MSLWTDPDLQRLFIKKTPLIDVRAPVEFLEGSIPNSVNLPIMNNEERHAVGTCYKEFGQKEAIELGHQLVGGKIKEERVNQWISWIKKNPQAEVFCFRGGLRSQITCQWIKEAGVQKEPIPGGYKRLRQFFLSRLEEAPLPPLIRIAGHTGSGKTTVLKQTTSFIDLEALASHRGSAFGLNGLQPSQITFENHVAYELLKLEGASRIIVEDESAVIGRVAVPRRFFTHMRSSPMVILQVDEEQRIANIFEDYVRNAEASFFLQGLGRIQKKLGAAKTQELADQITRSFAGPMILSAHAGWIVTLLREYYDPLYQKDIRFNREKVIFEGNEQEVLAFLGRT